PDVGAVVVVLTLPLVCALLPGTVAGSSLPQPTTTRQRRASIATRWRLLDMSTRFCGRQLRRSGRTSRSGPRPRSACISTSSATPASPTGWGRGTRTRGGVIPRPAWVMAPRRSPTASRRISAPAATEARLAPNMDGGVRLLRVKGSVLPDGPDLQRGTVASGATRSACLLAASLSRPSRRYSDDPDQAAG